ncbi:MAG: urease accessory UreF family protein [Pseudomonadota bacterium]
MSTDLLTLMQWMSPGFPVGAFAYSHGLEAMIDQGAVASTDDLRLWLEDVLISGGCQADLTLLARAYRGGDLADLDDEARAFAASAERLTETLDQGAAFARTVDAVWHTDVDRRAYPVAVGRAAAHVGLALQPTAEAYAHAFLSNLIFAAQRLMPLGQTDAQHLLNTLNPLVVAAAQGATDDPGPLYSNCIAADIAAMRHETQYSKVFRT